MVWRRVDSPGDLPGEMIDLTAEDRPGGPMDLGDLSYLGELPGGELPGEPPGPLELPGLGPPPPPVRGKGLPPAVWRCVDEERRRAEAAERRADDAEMWMTALEARLEDAQLRATRAENEMLRQRYVDMAEAEGRAAAADARRRAAEGRAAAAEARAEEAEAESERRESEAAERAVACVVCMDRPRSVLLKRCGHVVLCDACLHRVMQSATRACPVCRASIWKKDPVTGLKLA